MRFACVLDCTGRDFSPEWDRLHGVLKSYIASAPQPRHATAGPATRSEVTTAAAAAASRWRNQSAAACNAFPGVLSGNTPVRELRGFCVHGYCVAVYWAFLLGTLDGSFLHEATQCCLGFDGAWWSWNFLGESRWAPFLGPTTLLQSEADWRFSGSARNSRSARRFRHLDLPGNVDHSWAIGPSAKLDTRASTDRYFDEYQGQLQESMERILPHFGSVGSPGTQRHCVSGLRGSSRVGEGYVAEKRKISFAGFGVHLTTLLEPVSAIREIVPANVKVSLVLFGTSHPPPELILREVCADPDSPPEGVIDCFISTNPGESFWMGLTDGLHMAPTMGKLAAVVSTQETIRDADCLVCGGGHAPTLCMLLRMVTSTPMLFTLQAPLSFRMPKEDDQRALLVAFFREMARPSTPSARGRTVASTSLLFLQRQVWVQTGCLLPVVRNHNLYATRAAERHQGRESPGSSTEREVVFWQNHVSLKPDCCMVLWRFVKQMVHDDFPFRLVFKNVRGLPTYRAGRKVYTLGEHESVMLRFSDLHRRFVGAVLFPHDVGMISFDDLYALDIPLFLPDDEMVASMAFAQVSSTRNYPWYLLREEHASLRYFHADTDTNMPWEPGWGGREAVNATGQKIYLGHGGYEVAKIRSAVSTSNFALFPHVRRFRSIVDLLRILKTLSISDLAETSRAMKRTRDSVWQVTSEFYKRAACQLLLS
eukprot:TRINITY_DN34847_c0_g1_i1.p1 TRINITY_DN34847_c0_g1~~TRINITY_DN34847_c0_g1_i1.p1  ORF type:complete len:707 (+),score=59.23 TRINITY_DN34847_c0_g1_i1:79-2199(+)